MKAIRVGDLDKDKIVIIAQNILSVKKMMEIIKVK